MASIRLSVADRNALLDYYRRDPDPQVRQRAHILLLLGDGHAWATIVAVLFTSPTTIARWKRRFDRGGVDEILGRPRGRRRSGVHTWAAVVIGWVLTLSPTAFRFARSRWSCEAVAVVLREDFRVRVGRETVRLWLREAGLVWRRPRPVISPKDPDRERKLAELRVMLHGLPDDETAVFMDEVDVNLNPKVGCMWMLRGEQAAVETPGNNQKRYLAGSIHWRTGRVILTEGKPREGRSAALFCRHLDDLRRAFRQYKVIHVICDNAGTHTAEGSKLDAHSGIRRQLEQHASGKMKPLRFRFEGGGWGAAREYARAGLGVAVLPLSMLVRDVPPGYRFGEAQQPAEDLHVAEGTGEPHPQGFGRWEQRCGGRDQVRVRHARHLVGSVPRL